MNKGFLLLPLFAGVAIAIQAVINGQLRLSLQNPYYTAFISFLTGTFVCALIVLFNKQPVPPLQLFTTIPWYKLTGGLLGVFIVTSVILAVPANKLGFAENGGPFSLWQLKVIQEVITLVVFTIFTVIFFKNENFKLNHFISFALLVAAVYFIFKK